MRYWSWLTWGLVHLCIFPQYYADTVSSVHPECIGELGEKLCKWNIRIYFCLWGNSEFDFFLPDIFFWDEIIHHLVYDFCWNFFIPFTMDLFSFFFFKGLIQWKDKLILSCMFQTPNDAGYTKAYGRGILWYAGNIRVYRHDL